MSLLLILRKIWKYKLVTIPICLLVGVGAFYVVAVTAPTYEASATYILVSPPAPPTETDIARDPALGKVHSDNPYVRFSDQSVLVQVLASRLNSDENRASLIKQGADPNYLAQPSAQFGFSAPILQITGMGPTATLAIRSTDLVGEDLLTELDKMQAIRGVDKPYRITAEAVVPARDAKLKPSGKMSALVAVMVLGLIMLFMAVSVLDAIAALRSEWAQRRRAEEVDVDPDPAAVSFTPPVALHRNSPPVTYTEPEDEPWPLEAQR